jgi:hypothetical protein
MLGEKSFDQWKIKSGTAKEISAPGYSASSAPML